MLIALSYVQSNVESTQDIVELILDSNRNKLLAIDLKVSIGTLGVGSSAAIAGLFGMNVHAHTLGYLQLKSSPC